MHHVRSATTVSPASSRLRRSRPGVAVFVHCGVLSVGVRGKLGLPSRFDMRLGDPLDVSTLARAFPTVPFIIPHFGAGSVSRGADGGRYVSEHASGHVELERLDSLCAGH